MQKPPAGRPAGVPKPYRRSSSRKWQIKVKVPKGAGGPGQVARSLETTDYAEALRRAPLVVAAIRREIEGRRRNVDGTRKDLKGTPTDKQRKLEAWWAAHRLPHPTATGRFIIPDQLEAQWEADLGGLLGDPVNVDDGEAPPEYRATREAAALHLAGLTLGTRVPVASELERYLIQQGIRPSYASRTRRAVAELAKWLQGRPGGDNVHAVSGRSADGFADHVEGSGVTTATVNSLTSALTAYWKWLVKRGIAERNPWVGQGRKVVDSARNAAKRPFDDDEIVALLSGQASRTLHDMMRLAALTGMRLTEIGGLHVRGAGSGVFYVEKSKTKSGVRAVPVHPALVETSIQTRVDEILAGRADGRANELRNGLRYAHRALLARIERGMTVEVRFLPLKPQGAGEDGAPEDAAAREANATLAAYAKQMEFPEVTDEPIIQLPRYEEPKPPRRPPAAE